MQSYQIYLLNSGGCPDNRDLIETLEKLLGLAFIPSQNPWRGERFCRASQPDSAEYFVIETNFNSYENRWNFPEDQGYDTILYVNNTHRSAELREQLLNALEAFDISLKSSRSYADVL